MTLRREVEARGAFLLEDAIRKGRIARLEHQLTQGWRLLRVHWQRVQRLLDCGDLRRIDDALQAQGKRLDKQRDTLRELNQLRGIA